MLFEINRAIALGAKYGLKAVTMYCDSTVPTPEMGEGAEFEGSVGIVVTVAVVICALYIIAMIVGSMSKSVSGGSFQSNGTPLGSGAGLGMSNVWNKTFYSMDVQANSSFTLGSVLPIAIVGIGILTIIIAAFSMR
jgi:hypothetical protein